MIPIKRFGKRISLLFYMFFFTIVYSQNISIYSNELNQYRKISVSLPDGYEISNMKYPVVYLFDGNEYFPYAKSVYDFNTWSRYPPFIIVSISQFYRSEELSIGSSFENFILNELFPYIEKNYRTNGYNSVLGHSFGGAFVLDILLKSEKIKSAISISPTISTNTYNLLKIYDQFIKKGINSSKYIYLSYGKNDYENIIVGTNKFNELIKKHLDKLNLFFEVYEDEDHESSALIGIRRGLQHVFSEFFVPEAIWDKIDEGESEDLFYDYFNKLKTLYGVEISPSEDDYNQLGYFYLNKSNIERAIEIFKENALRFPLSANTYDSLADAYLRKKEISISLYYYGQALAIAKATDNDSYLIEDIEKKINEVKNLKK